MGHVWPSQQELTKTKSKVQFSSSAVLLLNHARKQGPRCWCDGGLVVMEVTLTS